MSKYILRALIPGRPIESLCGTPIHKIGHFVDYILLPIVQRQETYLKDTIHFNIKTKNIIATTDTYLVTLDAKYTYTNLEFDKILSAVDKALDFVYHKIYLPLRTQ